MTKPTFSRDIDERALRPCDNPNKILLQDKMASHITLHACALLRKTSVQNNADFLRVNERITVDVAVDTVGSFLNAFLTAQVRKDSAR